MSEDFIGRPLDLLLGFEPGMKMPTVRSVDDRPWHPEDALERGPGTPAPTVARTASEDAYHAWRRKHVIGLRWSDLSRRCARQAADDARMLAAGKIMRKLIETGRVDMSDIEDTDRFEVAMTYAVSVVKNGAENTKDRLAAAKMVAEWAKAKPAANANVTVQSITAFLDEAPDE